jgi:hypothetical protein
VATTTQQCRLVLGLVREIWDSTRGKNNLNEYLAAELDADIPHSVDYAWVQAVHTQNRGLLMALSTRNIYDRLDLQGALVGGNSSRERLFLEFARERELETYYIPHSITHPVRNLYPHAPETTMFVESEFGATYLRRNFAVDRLPTLEPLGRPYFESLLQYQRNEVADQEDQLVITLATQQNHASRAREMFGKSTLKAINNGIAQQESVQVIIKIHPDETSELYEQLKTELQLDNIDSIKIEDKNLYRILQQSDIVITVNSNVGVESMILGTPCVCVVLFEPWIPTYPYAEHDSVPVLTNQADVEAFFADLKSVEIAEIQREQEAYVSDSYILEDEMGEKIARYIERDCITTSDETSDEL